MNPGRTPPRFFRSARLSSASCLNGGWVCSHVPKGSPKPCLVLALISSGRNPRNDSLKKYRSRVPLSLNRGGKAEENDTKASSSKGNRSSRPASSQAHVTLGRSL